MGKEKGVYRLIHPPVIESVNPNPILPGATFTITGKGLAGGSKPEVKVGSLNLPVVAVKKGQGSSHDELTVVLPGIAPGEVELRVEFGTMVFADI